ncbi:MAG: WD40 repeat domain-containing protein [Bacteroidetes bacterium]|nr:WD40 repeat domain-containing protein [Bacteroidota bacterium]
MIINKSEVFVGHEGAIYTLEKSPDADFFFSGGSDGILSKWEKHNFIQPEAFSKMNSPIYAIRWIKERSLLLSGTGLGEFYAIDVATKKLILASRFHESGIFDIQFSLYNQKIYTGSTAGELAVWDLNTFALIKKIQITAGKVRSIAISNDDSELAIACGDGTIRILNATDLSEKKSIPAHEKSCNCVCYHPDKKYLISGGRDAHLRIWNTDDYSMFMEIPAHNYAIYSIAFSPDNKYFATASRDKTAKIWNSNDFLFEHRIDREQSNAHSHSVNKVLWLENDELLTAGDDRRVMLFTIET